MTQLHVRPTEFSAKLNINCCLKVFRNPHKNWGRNYGIRVYFELTFSAIIIDIGVGSFQFQTIRVLSQVLGRPKMGHSNLRRV